MDIPLPLLELPPLEIPPPSPPPCQMSGVSDLSNVILSKTYTLLCFTIANLSIIPHESALISVNISTDQESLYRLVRMNASIYNRWDNDTYPYRFIQTYIKQVFLGEDIFDTILF
jgi:hypothetical protein